FYYLKTVDANLAFYLMPARFWQFSLGALVSISASTRILRKANRHWILAPICIVLLCIIGADKFRVSYTVIITLSIALCLVFIKEGEERRYLTFRPVIVVGLYSYSLYLFHWPILTIFRQTISLASYGLPIAIS